MSAWSFLKNFFGFLAGAPLPDEKPKPRPVLTPEDLGWVDDEEPVEPESPKGAA